MTKVDGIERPKIPEVPDPIPVPDMLANPKEPSELSLEQIGISKAMEILPVPESMSEICPQ